MDVKTNLVVSGTQTIKSMTTAGFVKTSAAGLLSTNTLSRARAHCNSAATVTSAQSLIPLDDADYDTDSIVDLANDRIEPTKAGYYLVTGQLVITAVATTGMIFAAIWKNGGWVCQGTVMVNYYSSALALASTVSWWVEMNGSSDYLELRGYSNSNTTLNNTWPGEANYISVIGPF